MSGDGPFRPRSGPDPEPPAEPRETPAEPKAPQRLFRPSPMRSGSSRTSTATWILGVTCVVIFGLITLNSIETEGPGSRGVPDGEPLPEFAAPLAIDGPQGDAQVDPSKACDVQGEAILNTCDLRQSGRPVALAFFALRSKRCIEQIDVLQRLQSRFPDWRFAAVAIRGDLGDLRDVIRERRWTLPVAYDRDGAISNLYAVAVCPTITLAGRDGRVRDTELAFSDDRRLAAALEQVGR